MIALPGAPLVIHLDFETRSNADLKKVGQHVYAADRTTSILCAAYTLPGEDEIQLWLYTDEPPLDLIEAVREGNSVCAHNASFERAIWEEVCVKRMGWPPVKTWNCTLALAASLNLPLGLADVAKACGLPIEKDDEGRKLMLKMTKLAHADKDTPELLDRLGAYCIRDVEVEIAIGNKLGPMGLQREREIWLVDQKINARGVPIDLETVHAIVDVVEVERQRLNAELFQITGETVETAKQVAKLRDWLGDRGCILADMRADTVRDFLKFDHDDKMIQRALEIRQAVALGSVGKYPAMISCTSVDGRARGLFQYGGASQTVRWSGRRIQLQNLPRPTIKDDGLLELLLHAFRCGDRDMVEIMFGDVMSAAKDVLRAMIASPRGLIVSDFAQIELRVAAWCAGQQDLLDDLTSGRDRYKMVAATTYGVPVDGVSKDQRLVGKIATLGCQYGMGWMAFLAFLGQYGVDADEALSRKAVDAYRATHPKIVRYWWALDEAIQNALEHQSPFRAGPVVARSRGKGHLAIRLPSGRSLTYRAVQVEVNEMGRKEVSYYSPSKRCRVHGYGGKWLENVCQAIARDILADALVALDKAGQETIGHVHDEVIVEGGDKDIVHNLMSTTPDWCKGLPVEAETFTCMRYTK